MELSALVLHLFLLLIPAFIFFIVLLRIFRQPASPGRKKRLRFAAAFLGNPLMPLHAIVHPQVRYVIAEQLKEDSEDDQDADPLSPTQHLQRQLRKIRNGEHLDHITTRLR